MESIKDSASEKTIRLPDFIENNIKEIVGEWEAFAATLTPAAQGLTTLALRDHIYALLSFIVSDIKSAQTGAEQKEKSQGKKERDSTPTAAETHTALRMDGGFDIDQMVSEYRALRASVIKLWSVTNADMRQQDVLELTRFNEAIDQELAESVSHYTKKISYSKDLFVGILSHELRNPLNVISMSSQLMLNMEKMSDRQTMLANQILDSTKRITSIVDELLDLTRARFGSGITLTIEPMDMEFLARQLVDEMQMKFPMRKITLAVSGNLKGEWDKPRLGQVLVNLIGNAVQYSFKDSSVNVTLEGTKEEVLLSVQNKGVPIPPEKIETLFDSLVRAVTDEGDHPEASTNLGLGLYITKEIITAHGGKINVTSTEEEGTVFIVHFPRKVEHKAL